MGKHFNAELYRQFDRTMDKGLDEVMGDGTQPLTDDELDRIASDDSWNRKDDATADELDRARWAYARPVCRVDLWDEPRRAACAI